MCVKVKTDYEQTRDLLNDRKCKMRVQTVAVTMCVCQCQYLCVSASDIVNVCMSRVTI